jgi:hypothetical protein
VFDEGLPGTVSASERCSGWQVISRQVFSDLKHASVLSNRLNNSRISMNPRPCSPSVSCRLEILGRKLAGNFKNLFPFLTSTGHRFVSSGYFEVCLFQLGQVLRVYTKANGSSPPRGSFDEAVALQSLNHIVNRGWGNPEVAFQIRFRGSLAVDLGVVVDKGQILALFGGE